MKSKIKLLIAFLLCVLVLVALFIPHLFVGLRSWSLENAVEHGDVAATARLLNSGANPNMPDDGFSPLMQALQRRHDDVAHLLVDKGANVNAVGPFGNTPLLCADLSNINLVSYLIQCGADVNAQNNLGRTALISAAGDLQADGVHTLLVHGANPNAQDKDGQTALMQAITAYHSHDKSEQQKAIVKELLGMGAKIDIKDSKGEDAIMLAEKSQNSFLLSLMIGTKHITTRTIQ